MVIRIMNEINRHNNTKKCGYIHVCHFKTANSISLFTCSDYYKNLPSPYQLNYYEIVIDV